jgi:NADH-quinone oxidoreductase subunit H
MFNVDPNLIIECSTNSACSLIRSVALSFLLFFILLTAFAYGAYYERRLLAWIQQRIGPNRVGPLGLLQPLAEGIKLIFKEDVVPKGADKPVFWLAPVLKAIPSLMVVAVVPLGPPILVPWFDGLWYRVPLTLIDQANVGVLFVLAFLSLGSYGVALAGWASNNKYAMLGGLRASAQMVSYELSMGLTMAVPILLAASMNLNKIVDSQVSPPVLGWYIFQNPVSAIVLLIAFFAETARAPFDLPEADTELTAGFMTEYSGMKFALFFMAEYISMIGVGMIFASLYLGGYHFVLVDQVPLLGPVVLGLKAFLFISLMIWVRATIPRMRYDQLMQFGWKLMLPLALLGVGWSSVSVIVGDAAQNSLVYFIMSGVFTVIAVAAIFIGLRPKPEPAGDSRVEVIDLENRRSVGRTVLFIGGALVSIPFVIFGGIADLLKKATRPAA